MSKAEEQEVVEEFEQEVEEVVLVEEVKSTRKNRLFYTNSPTGEKVIKKY